MKTLLLLALLFTAHAARADVLCQDLEHKTQTSLLLSMKDGYPLATASSKIITDYYAHYGMEIKDLTTVIDPKTGRPIFEKRGDHLLFLLGSEKSQFQWQLEFAPATGEQSAAMEIQDVEGMGFTFDLKCETAPAL